MEPNGYPIPFLRYHNRLSVCQVLKEVKIQHKNMAAVSLRTVLETIHAVNPVQLDTQDAVVRFNRHRDIGVEWLKELASFWSISFRGESEDGNVSIRFRTLVQAYKFIFKYDGKLCSVISM